MNVTSPSANRQRLIIRVSRNSLSFSAYGADNAQIVYEPYALKSSMSVAANLREAFRTVSLLQQPYGKALVMVDTPALMVPIELFREQEQQQLYRHAFSTGGQDEVKHTVLPDLNCVAVFGVNRDLCTVVGDHFEQARFIAAVAPVWRHLHQRSYMGVRSKLYAYCHDHRLEVFSYGQNRFRFCNSFEVHDVHDVLYFLLYVWKQLGLQAEHDELHLVGDVMEQDWLRQELENYLKRVYFINPSGDFNRSAVTQIEGMPYDLMTLFVKGR